MKTSFTIPPMIIDNANKNSAQAFINGKWVTAKPENYKSSYLGILTRLKWAWLILNCRAVAVQYQEDLKL